MSRVLEAPILANRSLIEAFLVVAIVIAALLAIRQINHATAADNGPAVHSMAAPAAASSSDPTDESSVSGDSFNSSQSSQSSGSSTQTSLNVNGRDIPLPANGGVNQTLTDGSTTTTINAQTSSDSSGSQGQSNTSNSSSVNIQVNSNSRTEASQ